MARRRQEPERPMLVSPAGAVPPHALDAEAACLSAALMDADARAQVAAALDSDDDWYSESNKWIWRAIVELERSSAAVDVVTVAGWLRDHDRINQIGGPPYLAQITDATPSVGNVDAHARIVAEKARLRRLIAETQQIAAEGYGELGSATDFLLDAEARVTRVTSGARPKSSGRLGDIAREAYAKSGRVQAGEQIAAWSSGYRELDELFGGLKPRQVYVIAGRPGMGKTALAFGVLERAVAANAGIAGVGFSLEMDHDECAQRAIARSARVPLSGLERGVLTMPEWRRAAAALDHLGTLPVWIDDTNRLTPHKIRSLARRHFAELRKMHSGLSELAVVVVDYAQLLSADGDHESRVMEYEAISRELKLIAGDLGCCLIVVAQLNRANVERGNKRAGTPRPQLSDLKGSGAWEQDAHKVIFIHREDYYQPNKNEHDGLAEIILAKGRDTGTGHCTIRWEGWCTSFESQDDDPQRGLFETKAAE